MHARTNPHLNHRMGQRHRVTSQSENGGEGMAMCPIPEQKLGPGTRVEGMRSVSGRGQQEREGRHEREGRCERDSEDGREREQEGRRAQSRVASQDEGAITMSQPRTKHEGENSMVSTDSRTRREKKRTYRQKEHSISKKYLATVRA